MTAKAAKDGTRSGAFLFAGASDIEAVLDRMAGELAARWDDPVLVGIRRRGVPLARKLADRLEDRTGGVVDMEEVELKRYSDDLDVLHQRPALEEPDESLDLRGRRVVLVDDVLYTGRTLARAMTYALDAGARAVGCAVLCVRRGSELPLEADVVGFRCDVGEDRIVEVRIPPYEDRLAIELRIKAEDRGEDQDRK